MGFFVIFNKNNKFILIYKQEKISFRDKQSESLLIKNINILILDKFQIKFIISYSSTASNFLKQYSKTFAHYYIQKKNYYLSQIRLATESQFINSLIAQNQIMLLVPYKTKNKTLIQTSQKTNILVNSPQKRTLIDQLSKQICQMENLIFTFKNINTHSSQAMFQSFEVKNKGNISLAQTCDHIILSRKNSNIQSEENLGSIIKLENYICSERSTCLQLYNPTFKIEYPLKIQETNTNEILQFLRRSTSITFPYLFLNGSYCYQVENVFASLSIIFAKQLCSQIVQDKKWSVFRTLNSSDLTNNSSGLSVHGNSLKELLADDLNIESIFKEIIKKLQYTTILELLQTYDIGLLFQLGMRQLLENKLQSDGSQYNSASSIGCYPEIYQIIDSIVDIFSNFSGYHMTFQDCYYKVELFSCSLMKTITFFQGKYYLSFLS